MQVEISYSGLHRQAGVPCPDNTYYRLTTTLLAMRIQDMLTGNSVDMAELTKRDRKLECNEECLKLDRNTVCTPSPSISAWLISAPAKNIAVIKIDSRLPSRHSQPCTANLAQTFSCQSTLSITLAVVRNMLQLLSLAKEITDWRGQEVLKSPPCCPTSWQVLLEWHPRILQQLFKFSPLFRTCYQVCQN